MFIADCIMKNMNMHDALRATIGLMDATSDQVKIRSSYNVGAFSFTPQQLAEEIRRHIPDFKITYKPDVRQQYADSWPNSIDDSHARKDWNWKPEFTLSSMTDDMLSHIQAMVSHH